MNKNTPHKEPVPELFEVSAKFVIGVLAATTLVLICLFGLDHLKLVFGVVGGALLISFAMDGIASALVGIFCDAARGVGRGLGYIVGVVRN
jgi:hypothetical protein